jgi:hypothetical protein
MIDAARVRQTIATLRAEADALEAELKAATANDAPPAVKPPEAAPRPPGRVIPAAPNPAGGLTNTDAFYAALRKSDDVFGGTITAQQFAGIEALLRIGAGRLPLAWMAYVLGTAYHESGHVMVAIREKGNGDGPDADPWDDYLEKYDAGHLAKILGNTPEADGDGVLYAGRGPVQITGLRNYLFATTRLRELGILLPTESLVDTPDLALDITVGAAICVFGMLEGWFTGKDMRTYINEPRPGPAVEAQFVAARRVVNGTDKAALIARYALAFMLALVAGGWR